MTSGHVKELVEHWRRLRGNGLRPTPGSLAIKRFVAEYILELPEDFRSYVELTDGICDNDSGVHFWSLSEIDRVPNILTGEKTRTIDLTLPAHLPDAGNLFVFADVLISSYFYAIRLSGGESEVFWIGHGEWWRASTNFNEFCGIYQRGGDDLAFIGEPTLGK